MKNFFLLSVTLLIPLTGLTDDDLDKLLDKPGIKTGEGVLPKNLLEEQAKQVAEKALLRVTLTETAELKRIREREQEPGPGRLIYKDDFESYKEGAAPKHWPAKNCKVVKVDTPGNKGKVMKFEPVKPYATHCYMDPKIFATNFRLKFDFLCGESGEVTWLTRLHGTRGHSLWSNENYYQTGFYTTQDKPLSFGTRHLWIGGGYPFVDALQPGVTTRQPSHQLAWHSAEIVMDDDRMIFKLNGVRLLDGHYPVLMARTRKDIQYGFGLVARDSYSSTDKQRWVFNDWYDNIEIYDLGTPVRERRWPRRLHIAPWGDDANSGRDPAHPWRTLHKAFSEMRQGDRLTLQEGTYHGDVEWADPPVCDLPRAGAALSDYPTVIRGTPHEKVTLTGTWRLARPGWMRVEDLGFAGGRAKLTIESVGKSKVSLRRLAFTEQSRGLALQVGADAELECGRSLFLGSGPGLVVTGAGKTDLVRSVFRHRPGTSSVRFVHCTFIGPGSKAEKTINCLYLSGMAEASAALSDPSGGRFDPKPGAGCINKGMPLPAGVALPSWADMPVVDEPDLGAYEYFPPLEMKIAMPAAEKDILTGRTIVVPLNERMEILRQAIAQLRPGVTVRVGPGLWSESGLALTGLRGEAYAPIRVESEVSVAAAIHGPVQISKCDQLHLKGFRIAGFKGTKPFKFSQGLAWSDCGRTWIEGCDITAFGHAGVGGSERGVTLLQNWIHHNGTSGLNHGIYWAGEGPCWVIGNTFYGNAGWGFHNHQGGYDGWRGWKHSLHHNLFIGPGGAMVTTGSRGRYFHNTVIRASNAAFWFYNDGHRDNLIANNIILDSANSIHTRHGNTFTHNLTFGNQETFLGESPVQAAPLFVDAARHDYHLKPQSPARKAGTPVGLTDDPQPTLGAYDGNTQWAPPKPLPRYVPVALREEQKKLKKIEPRLPSLKID